MSGWQQLRVYCGACRTWGETLPHAECTQGSSDSALFLDHSGGLLTCNTCHQVWLMEDIEAVCPVCNLAQQMAFREDTLYLHLDDQLLAVDGALVYVLLQSGSLVITHRSCLVLGENY